MTAQGYCTHLVSHWIEIIMTVIMTETYNCYKFLLDSTDNARKLGWTLITFLQCVHECEGRSQGSEGLALILLSTSLDPIISLLCM